METLILVFNLVFFSSSFCYLREAEDRFYAVQMKLVKTVVQIAKHAFSPEESVQISLIQRHNIINNLMMSAFIEDETFPVEVVHKSTSDMNIIDNNDVYRVLNRRQFIFITQDGIHFYYQYPSCYDEFYVHTEEKNITGRLIILLPYNHRVNLERIWINLSICKIYNVVAIKPIDTDTFELHTWYPYKEEGQCASYMGS